MKTIAIVLSVSVLMSLSAEAGWRKSHHGARGSHFANDTNGTLYLNQQRSAPAPQARTVAVATVLEAPKKEKKGLFGGLFKKKEPRPVAVAQAEAPAPVRVSRPQVLAMPAAPARVASTAPKEKKEGFFAKLFGKRIKRPAAPVHRGPNAVQDAVVYYANVLQRSDRSNTKVVIDVAKQRAFLLVEGRVAMDTPISTARPGKYTPRGTHYMGERVRTGKISTIYHVGMPYWMRLGGSLYGVHAGYLPGHPASAGCVRLPMEAAQVVFDNTRSGTAVSIQNSWGGYAAAMGQKDENYRVAGL
jgi:lipoprotein-anchoring transpeptidase ErfK/SrfK